MKIAVVRIGEQRVLVDVARVLVDRALLDATVSRLALEQVSRAVFPKDAVDDARVGAAVGSDAEVIADDCQVSQRGRGPLVTEDGPFPAAGDHEICDNALRALRAPERERIAFRRHDDSGIGGALNGDRFAVEGHFIGGAEGIDARPDEDGVTIPGQIDGPPYGSEGIGPAGPAVCVAAAGSVDVIDEVLASLARLPGPAIGAHIDAIAVGRRLFADRFGRIACVDARTVAAGGEPDAAARTVVTHLRLQMIVLVPRVGKQWILVDVAVSRVTALNVGVFDGVAQDRLDDLQCSAVVVPDDGRIDEDIHGGGLDAAGGRPGCGGKPILCDRAVGHRDARAARRRPERRFPLREDAGAGAGGVVGEDTVAEGDIRVTSGAVGSSAGQIAGRKIAGDPGPGDGHDTLPAVEAAAEAVVIRGVVLDRAIDDCGARLPDQANAGAATTGCGAAELAGDAIVDGAVRDGRGPADAADAATDLGATVEDDAIGDGGTAEFTVDASADRMVGTSAPGRGARRNLCSKDASVPDGEARQHAGGPLRRVEVESAVPVQVGRGGRFAVDERAGGPAGAAHRDGLAAKIDVAIAVARIGPGRDLDDVAAAGGVDGGLDRGEVARNVNGRRGRVERNPEVVDHRPCA